MICFGQGSQLPQRASSSYMLFPVIYIADGSLDILCTSRWQMEAWFNLSYAKTRTRVLNWGKTTLVQN